VAYESLLHEQRRVHHRRLLETIERLDADRLIEEVEWLAHHAVRAGMWDQRCRLSLQAAGRQPRVPPTSKRSRASSKRWRRSSASVEPRDGRAGIDLRFELRQSCVPLRDDRRVLDHLRQAEMAAESIGDHERLGWVFVYRTNGLFLPETVALRSRMAQPRPRDRRRARGRVSRGVGKIAYSDRSITGWGAIVAGAGCSIET